MYNQTENPYVFVSYAHADAAQVLPVIEALRKNNINVWYDEGIVAGSEWPEFIAEKVMNSTKFILFVSNAYLNSNNCKRELNFAISRRKNVLSVFLEQVSLSPGMEMQLGTYQAIFKSRFESDEAFCESLSREPFFDECKFSSDFAQGVNAGVPPMDPAQYTIPQQNFAQPVGGYAPNPAGGYNPNPAQGYAPVAPKSYQPVAEGKPKNKTVAALLSIFLGIFGVQFFYMRRYVLGILSILLYFTYIPAIASFIIGIILFIVKDEDFQQKWVKHKKR